MNIIIILLVIWEVYWKSHALWLSAKKSQKVWFIALLIINSLGILPIYYLYKNNFFNNKRVLE